MSDIRFVKRYDGRNFVPTYKKALSRKAELAISFAERWGMTDTQAGEPDGAGRATRELRRVEEVIDRAIDAAGYMLDRLESLGWMVEVPEKFEDEKEK